MAENDSVASRNIDIDIQPVIPDATAADADELLTDEERELLGLSDGGEGGEDTDEGQDDADQADEADADAADDADDEADQSDDDSDDDAAGDQDDEAAQDDTPDEADAEALDAAEAPDPKYAVPVVDTAEVVALKDEAKKALADYRDGEITEEEFETRQEDIQTRRDDAIKRLTMASTQRDRWMDQWNTAARDYQKEAPELWSDEHVAKFDAYVKGVTGSTDPAIANLPMRDKLLRAHRRYLADNEKAPAVPSARTKAQEDPAKKAGIQRQPKPNPPKTLANIPAAAASTTDGGRFDAIQRAEATGDPDILEAALDAMSERERDAWLAR